MLLELFLLVIAALVYYLNRPRQQPPRQNIDPPEVVQLQQQIFFFGAPEEVVARLDPLLAPPGLQPRSHLSLLNSITPAFVWDRIAEESGLQYGFAGDFAGHLAMPNELLPIHQFEIVVDSSATANNHQVLRDILRQYPNEVTITQTGHSIIIMDCNGEEGYGIAVQVFVAGCPAYPSELIPPPASTFYHPGNDGFNPVPTYEYVPVPGDHRLLPILRPDLLLQQRLTRFEETAADPKTKTQNCTDIPMIRHFLGRAAEEFRERPSPPFSTAQRQDLPGIFKRWVRYAETQGNPLTAIEVQDGVVLGLLSAEDLVSLGFMWGQM
jgi:hypothetical protein